VLCVIGVAISNTPHREILPPRTFPIYFDAQDIYLEQLVPANGGGERTISFLISDASDAVLTYYRKAMVRDGWKDISKKYKGASDLTFIFPSCPFYTANVDGHQEGMSTKVELRITVQGCR